MKCMLILVEKNETPHTVIDSILSIISSLIPLESRHESNFNDDLSDSYEYIPDMNVKGVAIFKNLKYGLFKLIESLLFINLGRKQLSFCQHVLWEVGNLGN